MYALVDCNNFYASCERVFNPALRGNPVCILSNNDGCIIARSNEVKAAGIPMGAPVHKWKRELQHIGAQVFSSNYALYGDMSGRVMTVLQGFAPQMEVYSIDEAFLCFSDSTAFLGLGDVIRSQVYQHTGIPVSVGFGATKTLAKLANFVAKKYKGGNFIISPENHQAVLKFVPVEEVWGIGRRSAEKLHYYGVKTVFDLTQCCDSWIRKELTIVGLKMVEELRGTPCFELHDGPESRKTIICSRSFGRVVSDRSVVREALMTHAARAAEKLRQQKSVALGITTYIRTNPFRPQDPQYQRSHYLSLPEASSNTVAFFKAVHESFEQIFCSGYKYHKAGVALSGIRPNHQLQYSLFTPRVEVQSEGLMQAVDALNQQYGQHTVQFGAMGTEKAWKMRAHHRSPNYTTQWEDRLVVRL